MGDLVDVRWQTPQERAYMRALDQEIVRLTRMVETLREAHAHARANRRGQIIQLDTVRRATDE